jgi:peptidoglycan/LPS O-acetylase OafA/YrhL
LFLLLNVLLEIQITDHPLSLGEVLEHRFFLRTLTAYHPTFFPDSWSLAIEEWFYLLFPAAVWLGLRFEKRFVPVAGEFQLAKSALQMNLRTES